MHVCEYLAKRKQKQIFNLSEKEKNHLLPIGPYNVLDSLLGALP